MKCVQPSRKCAASADVCIRHSCFSWFLCFQRRDEWRLGCHWAKEKHREAEPSEVYADVRMRNWAFLWSRTMLRPAAERCSCNTQPGEGGGGRTTAEALRVNLPERKKRCFRDDETDDESRRIICVRLERMRSFGEHVLCHAMAGHERPACLLLRDLCVLKAAAFH